MRIAPIFIFALLMSTASSGQVFENIWTNADQNISYEISDSGNTITFIDEGNAEQYRGCPGCGFPGDRKSQVALVGSLPRSVNFM
ncbi:MAG: hypothetical protein VX126_08630 [Planctomycetota bacterium]|nr:hypothetical protein [Planctomycetota bacterium]